MNPQTVWHVWRRLMREKPLERAAFDGVGDLDDFELSAEEKQIAAAYAQFADRARWFIVNYRYRLGNSFLNALETGAPMVLRVLLNQGVNVAKLAEQFLDEHAWEDYGPYVYRYCHTALEFLGRHEVAAQPDGFRSLIELESTTVGLMLDLARQVDTVTDTSLLRRSAYARTCLSRHRLSVWLRDKKSLGRTPLPLGSETYLVYVPDAESSHRYALLSGRAAELYAALHTPCSYSELDLSLQSLGYPPISDADRATLKLLESYRAVSAVGL